VSGEQHDKRLFGYDQSVPVGKKQIGTLFGGVELRLCCKRRIIGKEEHIRIVSAIRVSGYGKFGM
jgi:hypothetical protein